MKCCNGDIKWHFKRDCWCYNPILTHLLFNLILKRLKFKIKRSGAWMQNFKNFRTKWRNGCPSQKRRCFVISILHLLPYENRGSSLWQSNNADQTTRHLEVPMTSVTSFSVNFHVLPRHDIPTTWRKPPPIVQ